LLHIDGTQDFFVSVVWVHKTVCSRIYTYDVTVHVDLELDLAL